MPLVRSVAKSSKIYAYARMIPDVRGFAVTTRDCDVSRNVGPECSDGFSRNSPSRFIGARLKSRCHCSPTRGNVKQIEATVSIKAAHFVRRFRADTFGFACFRTDCSMRRGTGDECISLPGRNRFISRIRADAQPTLINIINLYGTSMCRFGSEADIRAAIGKSALPPKANIRHVAARADSESIAPLVRKKLGASSAERPPQ
jgi:hypothetical protein